MQGAHTATERFGNTATDGYGVMGEHQDRPNFNGHPVHIQGHGQKPHGKDGEEGPEMYTEIPHQIEEH